MFSELMSVQELQKWELISLHKTGEDPSQKNSCCSWWHNTFSYKTLGQNIGSTCGPQWCYRQHLSLWLNTSCWHQTYLELLGAHCRWRRSTTFSRRCLLSENKFNFHIEFLLPSRAIWVCLECWLSFEGISVHVEIITKLSYSSLPFPTFPAF